MRFRLRYLQHDLELTEGQFTVGRSGSCQLSLDDPLVSRRHALLFVTDQSVEVEDLGSRNGVLVNGTKIEGRVALSVGDRIVIGAQELTLLAGRETAHQATLGNIGMTMPRLTPSIAPAAPKVFNAAAAEPEGEPSVLRRVDQFKLLGGVAEKALAMGRAAEAERILAPALADVIESTRGGKPLPPTLVDQAAKYSSRLATATGKGAWADYVIELYAAQGRPAPAPVIDELYTAMRKVSNVDISKLRQYVGRLREHLPQYGPAERFLVQRIEGLERVATSR